MRVLIAYTTRTNTTKKIAEELARKLGADIEEIVDTRDRSGTLGYMRAGRDAMRQALTEIKPSESDPAKYDLVVIGTPVWAFTMTPAIRTYLAENKDKINKIACFTTQGGNKRQKVFDEIKKVIGKDFVAEIFFTTKEVMQDEYWEKLESFVGNLGKL